ncbi:MAG: D-alanyl-D-alanine carboxypeptidase [Eubacterium sp.]|nr:D-alanyl-D-alanine carboxypeptidase [Eubacterium sp.]
MKIWKKMIVLFTAIACVLSGIFINTVPVKADVYWPEGPEITTESAIIMEASTGTVLYEKNGDMQGYPASITKIMTALLAIENGNLDDVVEFSEGAVYNTEGSSIVRDVGEHLSLKDCLYSLMLASANDSAYAIAEHVGGDFDTFVAMMNDRAAKLGCTNTNFVNPHGLHDENHYTSVRDMALIAREAWKNETFRMFAGTKVYDLPPTEKHPEELTMQNHHAMLYPFRTSQYLYDYCLGGKTGFTTDSGNTLVTYAQKNGMTLICVVMRTVAPGHYVDTTALLNYCFDNFKLVNVAENEGAESFSDKTGSFNTDEEYLQIDKKANIILPATAAFSDVQTKLLEGNQDSSVVGTLQYTYGEHAVGTADIVLTGASTEIYPFGNIQELTGESGAAGSDNLPAGTNMRPPVKSFPIKIVLVIVIAAAAVLVIYLIYKKMKKPKFQYIKDNYRKKWKNRRK